MEAQSRNSGLSLCFFPHRLIILSPTEYNFKVPQISQMYTDIILQVREKICVNL